MFFVLTLLLAVSCNTSKDQVQKDLELGLWRGELLIDESERLPFHFDIKGSGDNLLFEFKNGEERIVANKIRTTADSVFVEMPVFNSLFCLHKQSGVQLSGVWKNLNRGNDYAIPFVAKHGNRERFDIPKNPIMDPLGGKFWEVTFSPETDELSPALGVFSYESEGRVTGTFATEKGDFRFLEGLYCDSTLRLSCFDGAHAFLFKAKKNTNGELDGVFWSGKHWQEPWRAKKNDSFSLSNPDSLSRLTVPSKEIDFSYPDLSDNMISLSDQKYSGKAVIIQVLGSWCPNCADESKMLQEFYDEHHANGLEIIGLCFEATRDMEMAKKRVKKFKESLGIEYDLCIAGYANKKEATETLGFVDAISSFPTSIVLDKERNLMKIHTGFYGPGTGAFYEDHKNELGELLDSITKD